MPETLRPPYELPGLRPFRTIQQSMRIQGCAVITDNGCLQSPDYVEGASGWAVRGDGTTSFTQLDADLAAAQANVDEALLHGVGVVNALPTLPDADYPVGKVVYLTTDEKLYRNAADAWTPAVAAVDISGQITTAQVSDSAITTLKLLDSAITSLKLADLSVSAAKVQTDAITANKIAANAVTAAKILAGSITTVKIAAGAVTATEILAGAITTVKIAANAVTANEIAAGTITATQIQASTITATQLATNAITADKILAGAVTAGKVGANAITANEIAANAVTAGKILADAVTANKILAGAVTTNKLAADAVTAGKLAAIELEVGKYIRSTSYSPGVSGWSIDANGDVEFNDGTFRGDVVAGTLTGNSLGVDEMSNGHFDVNTTGWTAGATSTLVRVTSPTPQAGAGALRIQGQFSPNNSTVSATSPGIASGPGVAWRASVYVRLETYDASNKYNNDVVFFLDFYNGATRISGLRSTIAPTNNSAWFYGEIVGLAPANTTQVKIFIGNSDTTVSTTARRLFLDSVELRRVSDIEIPVMVTGDGSVLPQVAMSPGGLTLRDPRYGINNMGVRQDLLSENQFLYVDGPADAQNTIPPSLRLGLERGVVGTTEAGLVGNKVKLLGDKIVVSSWSTGETSGGDPLHILHHIVQAVSVPGGNGDTNSSSPTFATWSGSSATLDIPSWATAAFITATAAGVYCVTAATGIRLRLSLNGTTGREIAVSAYDPTISPRFNYSWSDKITGFGTGSSKTLLMEAHRSPASGGLRCDTNSDFTYQVHFVA